MTTRRSSVPAKRLFTKKDKAYEHVLGQLKQPLKLGYRLTDAEEKRVERIRDLYHQFIGEVDMKVEHIYLLGDLLEEMYNRGWKDRIPADDV